MFFANQGGDFNLKNAQKKEKNDVFTPSQQKN